MLLNLNNVVVDFLPNIFLEILVDVISVVIHFLENHVTKMEHYELIANVQHFHHQEYLEENIFNTTYVILFYQYNHSVRN